MQKPYYLSSTANTLTHPYLITILPYRHRGRLEEQGIRYRKQVARRKVLGNDDVNAAEDDYEVAGWLGGWVAGWLACRCVLILLTKAFVEHVADRWQGKDKVLDRERR